MSSLFQESKIGSITLKSRFIRAAMASFGGITDAVVDEYAQNASSGIGAILTGAAISDLVDDESKLLHISHDKYKEDNLKLINAAHTHKVPIITQICVFSSDYGPSAVPNLQSKKIPKELTLEQIKEKQDKLVEAAVRAKAFGYDGVEIHGAHTFFINQFMIPYYNRRTDNYGGSLENRARFILEVVERTRAAVGPDFGVWAKINAKDGIPETEPFGGIKLEEAIYLAQQLKAKGANAVEISGALNIFGKKKEELGVEEFFRAETIAIAEKVKGDGFEVILTGNNQDVKRMAVLNTTTDVHFFGLGRPLQSDPLFVAKLKKEAEEEEKKKRKV